jgi:hypothetical protein
MIDAPHASLLHERPDPPGGQTPRKTYSSEVAARRAIEASRVAGVAVRDIRLLTGTRIRDVRREPVGGFAGPVAPHAPVGTYGDRQVLRRQGAGGFAGDPDRQRQGSFADTDQVFTVTCKRDAGHRSPRSPAAPRAGVAR